MPAREIVEDELRARLGLLAEHHVTGALHDLEACVRKKSEMGLLPLDSDQGVAAARQNEDLTVAFDALEGGMVKVPSGIFLPA
jgi:hypothetical protein